MQFDDCFRCGEPIRRAPGGVWEHAVPLSEDEDDAHVAEPEEPVFDEDGIALPREQILRRPPPTLFDKDASLRPGREVERFTSGKPVNIPKDSPYL